MEQIAKMRFRLSNHAKRELLRRDIPLSLVEAVLQSPQQVVPADGGRMAYQSQIEFHGKMFLLRVIVAQDVEPAVVVTVYRTSRIGKYWRTE